MMGTLGRTGRPVSRLGLGLAALGRPGYINLGHADDLGREYDPDTMRAHAHAVLDRAWALGVRYFDAARSYGRGEEFLADWVRRRELPEGQFTIGSKWGYTYTADWQVTALHHEIKDHTLSVLRRQFAESKSLLGSNLHLYQIHSATLASGVLDRGDVLAELGAIREQGVAIGLSVTGPEQGETLARALDIRVGGEPLFGVVQATWNLLEPSVGPRLAQAHERGLGVIVKEALANGRLTERNTEPTFAGRRQVLAAEAERLECSLDALALAAVLAQPWVDVVLSGAARVEHLGSNMRALAVAWDERAEVTLAAVAEPAGEYWRTRGGLGWN
jgi:aryl-alcohol dehydrogenase-like predicted oxidoreductase